MVFRIVGDFCEETEVVGHGVVDCGDRLPTSSLLRGIARQLLPTDSEYHLRKAGAIYAHTAFAAPKVWRVQQFYGEVYRGERLLVCLIVRLLELAFRQAGSHREDDGVLAK